MNFFILNKPMKNKTLLLLILFLSTTFYSQANWYHDLEAAFTKVPARKTVILFQFIHSNELLPLLGIGFFNTLYFIPTHSYFYWIPIVQCMLVFVFIHYLDYIYLLHKLQIIIDYMNKCFFMIHLTYSYISDSIVFHADCNGFYRSQTDLVRHHSWHSRGFSPFLRFPL